jgi:probable FeS assembly SUF system protein SufT
MQGTEPILLDRDCEVIQIPGGARSSLGAGTRVRVVESAPGSYTIRTGQGTLYRVDARDADALRLCALAAGNPVAPERFREEMVLKELKKVRDPEIPVNIVDLGLIYSSNVFSLEGGGKKIEIRMSLTAPGCSMSDVIKGEVKSRLEKLPEVREVAVEVVFDPPWNPGMMSEAAKLQLGFDLDYGAPQGNSSAFTIIR